MMKRVKLWRTFLEGTRNYKRNGWLTAATVVVLTLSLFIVSLTAILGITAGAILDTMQKKISINVSFNMDVPEERILSIKKDLEKYREVESIKYTSRDQALEDFRATESNQAVIKQALDELGENPLLASLSIRAKDSGQYQLIAEAVAQSSFREDVYSINYEKNKRAIERLNIIKKVSKNIGLVLGSILAGVALLITFNTVRINMHSRKGEFEIMRLVGASNTYVRMPSIFEGMLYGLTAAAVTVVLLFVTIQFVSPFTRDALPQGSLFDYYIGHIGKIILLLLVSGVGIGALSGAAAVRRYLKV